MKKALRVGLMVSALSFPVLANEKNKETMFRDMDQNNNGSISRTEYTSYWDRKFTEADTNRDGSLSQQELNAMKDRKQSDMDSRNRGQDNRSQDRYQNQNQNR